MNTYHKKEFDELPLLAHSLLDGVPIHSLYRIDLDGGPSGMSILELKEMIGFNTATLEPGIITKALFWLRGLIGNLFGWDRAEELADSVSFLGRLTESQRTASQVPPGKKEGISRVLYCFENEFAAEIVNKTVHCFWVLAIKPTTNAYKLYIAVYVRRLNWFTPIYMALVSPVLHWIIYPALNKSILQNWESANQYEITIPAHS